MKTKKSSPDDILDEIHAIRRRINQEIAGMTPQEEIAYFHAKTAPIIKQYGMRSADSRKLGDYTEWHENAADTLRIAEFNEKALAYQKQLSASEKPISRPAPAQNL
jgi:hypothetical protein